MKDETWTATIVVATKKQTITVSGSPEAMDELRYGLLGGRATAWKKVG